MKKAFNFLHKYWNLLLQKLHRFYMTSRLYWILLTLFLVFHRFFEDLVLETIIFDILNYPVSSLLNDILFVGIFLLMIGLFIYKLIKSYKYSTETILAILLINLIYSVYRIPIIESLIFNDPINGADYLLSLKNWPTIKYLDLLFVYSALVILELIIVGFVSKFKKGTTNKTSQNYLETGYLFDEPLTEGKPDLLQRDDIAKEIALKISNTKSKNSSFALGINGEWGSGKTSFIHLIKTHLPKENKIIIKYNPWLSHDVQNIAISFFKTLSQELKPYHSGVSNNILKYARLLVKGSQSKYATIINSAIDYISPETSLQQEFDKINAVFKNLDKQIIIIIDDVDRLDHKEINELLKLIRNSANFANTVFIVAYDRNYLIEALKSMNSYSPYNYLEKIFQLEMFLPLFEDKIVLDKITEIITPFLTEQDKQKYTEILNSPDDPGEIKFYYHGHLKNIRDAVRFANSFLISYSKLAGNIFIIDLLNIEIVKLKYPDVYNLFFTNYNQYLSESNNRNSIGKHLTLLLSENNKTMVQSDLEKYNDQLGIKQSQIESINNLLDNIFFNTDYFKETKQYHYYSIKIPSNIKRYCQLSLLSKNIDENEFSNARKKSVEYFISQINIWNKSKTKLELISRLTEIKLFDDRNDFENIIQGILHFGRINVDEFFGTSMYPLRALINQLDIGKRYYKTLIDYESSITNLFKNAPKPYIFDLTVLKILREEHQTYKILEKKEIELLMRFYISEYLNSTKSFEDNIWTLMYNAGIETKNDFDMLFEDQVNHIKTIQNMIKDHIKNNNLKSFIKSIIYHQRYNENQYSISDGSNSIFDTREKLLDFIKKANDDSKDEYVCEFISFLEKLIDKKSVNTEFQFKHIKVEKKKFN